MNIILVCQEYYPESARGGIGTQTFLKAKGLSELGHYITIIARSKTSSRSETVDKNITEILLPDSKIEQFETTDIVQWISHGLSVATEIESLINKSKIDIIDIPEWGSESWVYLLNRQPWNTIPVVIQLHGPLVMLANMIGWPQKSSSLFTVGSRMEEDSIKMADFIYSSSKCSSRWVKDYYELSKYNIPVIHTGVDLVKFKPLLAKKNKQPTIVFIGKITQNKGVEELADAAIELAGEYPNLRVKFFGRDHANLSLTFIKKAKSKGFDELFEFPGFISKDEIPMELAKAWIFAAPSYYEGGPGFVYLEAMACGVPVIGCFGSGIDDVIENGKTGFLVEPKNTFQLKKVLSCLLSNKLLRKEMSKNALEYVNIAADSNKQVRKLENLYQSIIQKTISNK